MTLKFVHIIPTWEQFMERANRVLPKLELTLEQEVALSATLSLVRKREMRRFDAWKVLVFNRGMSERDFNRLWRCVRPSRNRLLVEVEE